MIQIRDYDHGIRLFFFCISRGFTTPQPCRLFVFLPCPNEFRHSTPEALHTKRRERPLLAKDGMIPRSEFSCNSWFTAIARIFYMSQSWDMGHIFYFPSEGRHTEDFYRTGKIKRLRPGSNPRTRVLTTRPPKPSWYQAYNCLVFVFLCGFLNRTQFGHRISFHM
jgi:hypothetical protein